MSLTETGCEPHQCACPQSAGCARAQLWRDAATIADFSHPLRAKRGCLYFIDVRGVELLRRQRHERRTTTATAS
jgi:hypothetical protein